MTRKPRAPWLVMGPEPHFVTCLRCNGTVPKPIMPLPFKGLNAYIEYATLLHIDCAETRETPSE